MIDTLLINESGGNLFLIIADLFRSEFRNITRDNNFTKIKNDVDALEYQLDSTVHIITETSYDEIDIFIKQYELIINEIISEYPINDFTRFEDDIITFYTAIVDIPFDHKNPIYSCIHKLFIGICLFFMPDKKKEAFFELSTFKYLGTILKIEFSNLFADQLLSILLISDKREKILIMISPDSDLIYRKKEKPLIKNIVIKRARVRNYIIKYKYSTKYKDLNSILTESLGYDYVYFMGHGDDFFKFVLVEDKIEYLEPKIINDFYFSKVKKPKLLALLSCAHDAYLPLANSGLFDYFIISENSGFEHSETFLKGFLYSLDVCKNIESSLNIGKIALMCRFEGNNQIEFYRKGNNEH